MSVNVSLQNGAWCWHHQRDAQPRPAERLPARKRAGFFISCKPDFRERERERESGDTGRRTFEQCNTQQHG